MSDVNYYTKSIQPPIDVETPNGRQLLGAALHDSRGFTIGLLNDHRVADRLNNLEAFYVLFTQMDGEYHLSERYNDGYVVATEDEWRDLKNLIKALGFVADNDPN